MDISKVAKNLEIFILGIHKPKDHWKKYQIKKK